MLSLGLNMPALLRGAGSSISIPSFSRDFVTVKTLNHGIGPDITFTRTGTATYFDSSGVLTTATANEPRFDHDPSTLESKGLLIEEGRTNSIVNSQGTGASAGTPGTQPTGWSVTGNTSGLTRTISTGTISGFNYIDVTFSGTTTGSISNLTFDPQLTTAGYTASSGQTWTGSVYLALVSGQLPSATQSIIISERDSSNAILVNTTASFSSATSSLQRFTVARVLNNASTAKVTFDIRTGTIATSTAVDFTLRIAAPQLEQGAFATSYIPTTSAAVARGADQAVVTPISSFYNPSESTLFSEAIANNIPLSGQFPRIVSIGNATNINNRIELYTYQQSSSLGLGSIVQKDSVTQYSVFAAASSVGSNFKFASSVKTDDFISALNGSLFQSADTSGTLPDVSTTTHFGIGRQGSGVVAGTSLHIRKVAYYPKRLSNERLRSLTT